MDLIRVRVQVQDDLHTPEKLLLQELWSQDVFLSWPQILWNEILAYRYYNKVVDNYEKGEYLQRSCPKRVRTCEGRVGESQERI